MYVCVCVCKHICVCICDMTHSYVGLELFTFVWNNGFHDDFVVLQVTRMHVLTHSHVTYSYVPHDVFMCDTTHPHVTLLYHTCDITHTYVPHDSFICAVWLIHMCHLTYDSFVRVTSLLFMCHMTHSYLPYDSFICDMTHSYVPRDSFIRGMTPS